MCPITHSLNVDLADGIGTKLWESFERVNQLFASKLSALYRPKELFWVHGCVTSYGAHCVMYAAVNWLAYCLLNLHVRTSYQSRLNDLLIDWLV